MLFIPDWPHITREQEQARLYALMWEGFVAGARYAQARDIPMSMVQR